MNTGRKGARIELLAKKHLEQAGYLVLRSSGSHSPVDLVALDHNGTRWIQVKSDTDNRTMRPSEMEVVREELRDIPHPPNASLELWIHRTGHGWIRQEVVA